ncbi:MAG TPA: alpha/beta hydrolase [Acidobacteriaceae bacterium]
MRLHPTVDFSIALKKEYRVAEKMMLIKVVRRLTDKSRQRSKILIGIMLAVSLPCLGQQCSKSITQKISCIDKDGTARITRIIPIPDTVSAEAQEWLRMPSPDLPRHLTLEVIQQFRVHADAAQKISAEEKRKAYPVNMADGNLAGVPVEIFTPMEAPKERKNLVLINLHGGGFVLDAGSLTEGVPIANLTRTKVIAVKYRLAPESPFPAAVDDSIAVYREVLKKYRAQDIGVFGTSAGAILTAEFAVRARQLGLPLPSLLGFFSGTADLSKSGDSESMYTLAGLNGDPQSIPGILESYIGNHDRKDPVLSPLYADLRGFPPTLCMAGTRDSLLSETTIFHRALLKAGVDARLVVFEAMPHAFWGRTRLPEAEEALQIMAEFIDDNLGKQGR